jgi:hypothetical protein
LQWAYSCGRELETSLSLEEAFRELEPWQRF